MRPMASCGRTFSFGEPCSIVGAIVVCNCAAPAGLAANLWITRGPNNQVLATAMRVMNGICGARAASIFSVGPSIFRGNGLSAIATTAWARVTTAVDFGGIEEWPPALLAVILNVA